MANSCRAGRITSHTLPLEPRRQENLLDSRLKKLMDVPQAVSMRRLCGIGSNDIAAAT